MGEASLRIRETGGGVELAVHVQPRARRSEIAGRHDRAVKVRIAAPPVDDTANRALIDFFASCLQVSRSRITIVSGERSRDKTLRIEGITAPAVLRLLGA
jgi:uncharacterized protein (TIGR00251 family)